MIDIEAVRRAKDILDQSQIKIDENTCWWDGEKIVWADGRVARGVNLDEGERS